MSLTRYRGAWALCLSLAFLGPTPSLDAQIGPTALPTITLAVDLDDDDANGLPDSAQLRGIPSEDLVPLRPPETPVTIHLRGPLRLVEGGVPIGTATELRGDRDISLQATGLPTDASEVEFRAGDTVWVQPVQIIELQFLNHEGTPLLGAASHLGFTRRVPNDWTLPRRLQASRAPHAPEAFRVRIRSSLPSRGALQLVRHRALEPSGTQRIRLELEADPEDQATQNTPWLRPISIRADLLSPGIEGRLIHASLRDRLRVIYENGDRPIHQDIGFGDREWGPRHPLRAQLRIRILRTHPGGPPVIGRNEAHARQIARRQVELANQVWAQCFFDFGAPSEADIEFIDPPVAHMISVAHEDGLPARGGGVIRFTAGSQTVEVTTRRGARPVSTALDIATAIREHGLQARVFQNPRSEVGAFPSADIVVTSAEGLPLELQAPANGRLSTDPRQRVDIASVELGDGLNEFDNHLASSGTMEERALLRAILDDDPETIDLIIVNRFSRGTRRGEAFIEADGSAFQNVVILDRAGLETSETSWTQAHEIGHVLLDNPYHRDDYGPDESSLLMDSDARDATSHGPRRIPWESCLRARQRSGPQASPTLLQRVSDLPSSPRVH